MSTLSSTLITRDQLKAKRTLVPIEELKPWTKNPRAIEKTDYKRLKERCAGIQFKPLLVMSDGTVLGGNMRLIAYDDLGKKMIWVSIIEFEDYAGGIVAYINGEMDIKEDGTARMFTTIEDGMVHYAITDNEEFGKYVDQELAELIQPLDLNLQEYKVNLGALKTLEDVKLDFGPSDKDVVEDEAPEVSQEPAISQLGEVYQLGRHRLMCGDSTKIEDVEKLMNGQKADMVFTDPPYGLGGYGGRNGMELKGDDGDDETIKSFYDAVFSLEVFLNRYEIYVWGNYKNLMHHLDKEPRDVIVWRKNNFGLGNGYRGQYELCFYYGSFDGSDSDVWDVAKDVDYQHPTQKPVEIPARGITNSSNKGAIVIDLFGGSGSTLIACEQLNRICYMMEIDPKYCDVIRKRYAKFIGKEENWESVAPKI